ncbi:MAG: magnesium transporter [Candidatus Geothermincolia bacterium]
MIYLSQILDKQVRDSDGRNAGRVFDIAMAVRGGFPEAVSLVISHSQRGRRSYYSVPWSWVSDIEPGSVSLALPMPEPKSPPGVPASDLQLRRHLLDRQIMDVHGRKVVRVNDLRLARFDGSLRLTGVDVSLEALLRRLGLERLSALLRRGLGISLARRAIPWNYIAPLEFGHAEGLKLTLTQKQLRSLHPTDLADLLEQVDSGNRNRLLGLIDNVMAAESLSEVDPDRLPEMLASLSAARAGKILEVMPPDEAADLLGILERERAESLLAMMGVEEAGVIRELLGYAKHTAGGRMTPDFIAVGGEMTALSCIELLRLRAPSAETIYYVYVVDDEERLKGVLSLRDLLQTEPDSRLDSLMITDSISVEVDDDQETVADLMRKYNLLALPVVDEANVLKGIVTVDDMIDVLRQESAEDISHMSGMPAEERASVAGVLASRIPIMLITVLGGLVLALAVKGFRADVAATLALVFFLPLMIRSSQNVGFFSQAVMTEAIGGRELRFPGVMRLAASEIASVLLLDVLLAASATGIALWLEGTGSRLAPAVGVSLFVVILLAALLGVFLPAILGRIRSRPSYTQARVISLAINICSVAAYFGLARLFLGAS